MTVAGNIPELPGAAGRGLGGLVTAGQALGEIPLQEASFLRECCGRPRPTGRGLLVVAPLPTQPRPGE
jgi:hypothetical protein